MSNRPYESLPHRQPFAMLDRSEVSAADGRGRAVKMITAGDSALLPDGSLPQIFLLEIMAQAAGFSTGRKGGSMFVSVSEMSFDGTAHAGDVVEVESEITRNVGNITMFNVSASAAGRRIAAGEIMLYFDNPA